MAPTSHSKTLSGATHALSHLLPKPPSLTTLPAAVLLQLTSLLSTAPGTDAWLLAQHASIRALHPSLLRPSGMRAQLALSAGARQMPNFAPCAALCRAHAELDPRLVRELVLLLAKECTVRVDRYRRFRGEVHARLAEWLDRVDAVTALWVEEGDFERMFGYVLKGGLMACEACLLATVGSDPWTVSDLRVSVLARQAVHSTADHHREPRLLVILEAWLAIHGQAASEAVQESSDVLVPLLLALREDIMRGRREQDDRRASKGKKARERKQRVAWTEQGLPMPRRRRRGAEVVMSGGLDTAEGDEDADVEDEALFDDRYAYEDDPAPGEQDAFHDRYAIEDEAPLDNQDQQYMDVVEEEEDVGIWTRRAQKKQREENDRQLNHPPLTNPQPNWTLQSLEVTTAVPARSSVRRSRAASRVTTRRSSRAHPRASRTPYHAVHSSDVATYANSRANSHAASHPYAASQWTDASIHSSDSEHDSHADAPPAIPARSSRRPGPGHSFHPRATYASSVYSETPGPPRSPSVATADLNWGARGNMRPRKRHCESRREGLYLDRGALERLEGRALRSESVLGYRTMN